MSDFRPSEIWRLQASKFSELGTDTPLSVNSFTDFRNIDLFETLTIDPTSKLMPCNKDFTQMNKDILSLIRRQLKSPYGVASIYDNNYNNHYLYLDFSNNENWKKFPKSESHTCRKILNSAMMTPNFGNGSFIIMEACMYDVGLCDYTLKEYPNPTIIPMISQLDNLNADVITDLIDITILEKSNIKVPLFICANNARDYYCQFDISSHHTKNFKLKSSPIKAIEINQKDKFIYEHDHTSITDISCVDLHSQKEIYLDEIPHSATVRCLGTINEIPYLALFDEDQNQIYTYDLRTPNFSLLLDNYQAEIRDSSAVFSSNEFLIFRTSNRISEAYLFDIRNLKESLIPDWKTEYPIDHFNIIN